MAVTEGSSSTRTLEDTPTWALAAVCFVLIGISIVLEHSIHLLDKWLTKRRKKALSDAVEKLKSELMLVGFISLLLTISQRPVAKICIPAKAANSMLPCHRIIKTSSESGRYENRHLAESMGGNDCDSKGKVSLISQEGLEELHRFIFILAATHVIFSVLTMALGRAKMKRWKTWEKETQTIDYQVLNDPNRFRYTRETTFGRRHMNLLTESSLHLWIKSFFRQFFNSVAKVDYLTLRHGFIAAHNSLNTFDFQKYIGRSLEDDFKIVVGISPVLWLVVVVFLLFDVHGWNVYLWLSFVPLIILLAMGTKLEVIVLRMALRLKNQSSVVKGTPVVQPNDELFWFGHPKFLLHFLHFTLFLNAFEIAFFIWITFEYGLKSCYHERIELIVARVVVAVVVQFLCSYITLPLYALMTQMGSQYKRAILEEQTRNALKKWHEGVKLNRRNKEENLQPEDEASIHEKSNDIEVSSPRFSPSPTLSRFLVVADGKSNDIEVSSPRFSPSPTLSRFLVVADGNRNREIIEEVVEHHVIGHVRTVK